MFNKIVPLLCALSVGLSSAVFPTEQILKAKALKANNKLHLFNNKAIKTLVNNKGQTQPKAIANEYFDKIIVNLVALMIENGFEVLALPDQKVGFKVDMGLITVSGEASMTEGWMRGLTTIHRTNDATLDYLVDGNINLRSELGFNDLQAQYTMKVKFMGLGPTVKAKVTIRSLKVFMDAKVKIGSPTIATIDEFDIKDPGRISVDFDGLGPLDFILETLSFVVANLFKGLIVNLISDPIKDLVQDILENLTNPPPPSMMLY